MKQVGGGEGKKHHVMRIYIESTINLKLHLSLVLMLLFCYDKTEKK